MKISEIILEWYKKNMRDLPWRQTKDPYKIWLSEVILQQTRVQQGLDYYLRFIEEFHDVHALASADQEKVIKIWQGLGYYSRARNLHRASQQIVDDYGGVFPESSMELKKLKGVGKYTSAAVASIAFNEPVSVIDGNVSRVVSRLFGISTPVNSVPGEKEICIQAKKMLNRNEPGEHNQAMMEFGALQCVPVNPVCSRCPVKDFCQAYSKGKVMDYPVKIKKKSPIRRYFTYLIIREPGSVIVQQRNESDIWRKMYEFPLIESNSAVPDQLMIEKVSSFLGIPEAHITIEQVSNEIKHQLTHQTIIARFVHVKIKFIENSFINKRWIRASWDDLDRYPVPRLIDRYLEQLNSRLGDYA